MKRTILAVIGGLVVWASVATLLNFGVRALLPGYTTAEPALAFTLAMKIARLSVAVAASLIAGMAIARIAPSSRAAPWIAGLLLLAAFLPIHLQIGARLPLWYHLFFLTTLAPLVAIGARLARPRSA